MSQNSELFFCLPKNCHRGRLLLLFPLVESISSAVPDCWINAWGFWRSIFC